MKNKAKQMLTISSKYTIVNCLDFLRIESMFKKSSKIVKIPIVNCFAYSEIQDNAQKTNKIRSWIVQTSRKYKNMCKISSNITIANFRDLSKIQKLRKQVDDNTIVDCLDFSKFQKMRKKTLNITIVV